MLWFGPNGLLTESDHVSIGDVTRRDELSVSRLTVTELQYKDSGQYQCSVNVTSVSPYVSGSSETATTLITVLGMLMQLVYW